MKRYYYSNSIDSFLVHDVDSILGSLSRNSEFSDELTQKEAWYQEVIILKDELYDLVGHIYFEYSIPRMGRRIDVVLIIENVLFVLEFKVGQKEFYSYNVDQVWDYALDLKYFHEPSAGILIAPILIATEAENQPLVALNSRRNDNLFDPIKINRTSLGKTIKEILSHLDGQKIDPKKWSDGRYSPTPTIIEAATSLYNSHTVEDIYRSDALADSLNRTSDSILEIIEQSRNENLKSICFVTGVPGSGKTLIGLKIATKQLDASKSESSVFLSGNGPLVAILRESLTRDKVKREKDQGRRIKKGEVLRSVKAFIQNVHHFRDEGLVDMGRAPVDHVAIFDEAQRAWNLTQTASFMSRKKKIQNFLQSEPGFLISCLDRHKDWAVVICLVGGGQEINVGEAGISEWINSICSHFPKWDVYVSNKLSDSEYSAGGALELLKNHRRVFYLENLHLSVSMRSFRAENLSHLVKDILDLEVQGAKQNYQAIKDKFEIVLTRDIHKAKTWLRAMARGNERYGIVVSSRAERLKPYAIDVKSPMDPVNWFLNSKDDVRSSYYLEQVATEFDVQGLELDWVCVAWDGDFRHGRDGWKSFEFRSNKWQRVVKEERKMYLKNAYRVLLTRARLGMIIVVPEGDSEDATRIPEYYDSTYDYLQRIGFKVI